MLDTIGGATFGRDSRHANSYVCDDAQVALLLAEYAVRVR
jgi:hypothetical protein